MELRIEKLENVYTMLIEWWEGHDFPIVHPDILSDEIFVCYKDNIAIYAINVYLTNSQVVWIGFPVSNPFVEKEFKEGGFDFLIKETNNEIKSLGFSIIFTTSPIGIVQDVLLNNGFKEGDTKINHYIKQL